MVRLLKILGQIAMYGALLTLAGCWWMVDPLPKGPKAAAPEEQPGGSLCALGPFIFREGDVLTPQSEDYLLALDESGQTICGWQPPPK